jgi:catechol 2,3-dioxygenase-like lactoylglutathione lyase family enzyme
MSLRISDVAGSPGTTLRVDGRLSGDGVPELRRAGAAAAPPVVLELGGLQFADADGIAALRALRAAGVRLRHVPGYVALLLDATPPLRRRPSTRRAPRRP